jgi:NhaP-type Na+/H+ or K+/H+ antiporter
LIEISSLTACLLLAGGLLVAMALAEPAIKRLPLSPALVYLLCGWLAATLATPPLPSLELRAGNEGSAVLRELAEIAVLLSLFAIGLKIRMGRGWAAWRVPVLLATFGVLWAVLLGTGLAWLLLPLSVPQAFLLAAMLAPTDPVLASELQVHGEHDRDALRLGLSAEGALNDATAYPVVMLALGLLGLHEINADQGPAGLRWFGVDLLWSMGAGAAVGIACGRGIGHIMRRKLRAGITAEWDELLYIGTIALVDGLATLINASPFLAMFAAGATLLRRHPGQTHEEDVKDYSQQLLDFGAQCERLVEVLMVLLIGAGLTQVRWSFEVLVFGFAMVVLVRPISVFLSLPGRALSRPQRRLTAWLGIRGVGSVFYLMLAFEHGVKGHTAQTLLSASLVAIALSIALHGVSTTPLMNAYQRRRGRRTPPSDA